MSIPTVFISYSHDDRTIIENDLLPPLRAIETTGSLRIFYDQRIDAGSIWNQKLQQELDGASVAVVVITSNYLSSDFCMKQEWPRILARSRAQEVKLYLVCARLTPDAAIPPEMAELQFAVPCSNRPLPERVWVELANQIPKGFKTAQPVLGGSTGSAPSYGVCLQRAKQCASEYSTSKDSQVREDSLRKLVELCLQRGTNRDIVELAKAFSKEAGDALQSEKGHKEILALLEGGLPEHPAHLEGIAEIRFDALKEEGYPRLLQGIHLSETRWEEAIKFLAKELLPRLGVFKRCPLRLYALGQAYRQLERKDSHDLENSRANLLEARNVLEKSVSDPERCDICSVGCSKRRLLAHIERGLGVVHRQLRKVAKTQQREAQAQQDEAAAQQHRKEVQQNEIEARQHYDAAKQMAQIVMSDSLLSDISYSAGYFYFELAGEKLLDPQRGPLSPKERQLLLKDLNRARADLITARDKRYHWPAPKARLVIADHMIAELTKSRTFEQDAGDFRSRYVNLWQEIGGGGLAPELTRVLCGVGAAALGADEPTGEEVWEVLKTIVQNHFMAKGPVDCHLFDILCVLAITTSADPAIARVADLLKEISSRWTFNTKPAQDALFEEYLAEKDQHMEGSP